MKDISHYLIEQIREKELAELRSQRYKADQAAARTAERERIEAVRQRTAANREKARTEAEAKRQLALNEAIAHALSSHLAHKPCWLR
jgi:outer membrane PBP1 activator LpoA protein